MSVSGFKRSIARICVFSTTKKAKKWTRQYTIWKAPAKHKSDVSGKRLINSTSPRPLAAPLPKERGKTNFTTIQFDISKLAHGTYFVRMKAGAAVETTKFAY
jgi:hypothetical protein